MPNGDRMATPKPKTLKIRGPAWERAEKLAPHLSENGDLRHALGGSIKASDVLRIAVERGLEALERERFDA